MLKENEENRSAQKLMDKMTVVERTGKVMVFTFCIMDDLDNPRFSDLSLPKKYIVSSKAIPKLMESIMAMAGVICRLHAKRMDVLANTGNKLTNRAIVPIPKLLKLIAIMTLINTILIKMPYIIVVLIV